MVSVHWEADSTPVPSTRLDHMLSEDILYLKVDEGEHYVDLTGVVAEGDGGTRVRVSRVKRSEDGGWVVVGAVEDDDETDERR